MRFSIVESICVGYPIFSHDILGLPTWYGTRRYGIVRECAIMPTLWFTLFGRFEWASFPQESIRNWNGQNAFDSWSGTWASRGRCICGCSHQNSRWQPLWWRNRSILSAIVLVPHQRMKDHHNSKKCVMQLHSGCNWWPSQGYPQP